MRGQIANHPSEILHPLIFIHQWYHQCHCENRKALIQSSALNFGQDEMPNELF